MAKSKRDLGGSPDKGRDRVREVSEVINRRYGTHTALPLNVAAVADVERLPFGVLDMDWKTRGGLVIGRVNRLWGKKSTLKTTLCLRAVAQAQRYCRHCKAPIVEEPTTGRKNCRCPDPRYTMADPGQFALLTQEQTIQIRYGMLPAPATMKKPWIETTVEKKVKGKTKKSKVKVLFEECDRNEPWRCIFIDSERTIDKKWAQNNGVDTSLVALVGGKWAEMVLDTTEELILTREFDLIVIDSLAMLTPEDEISKSHRENPKVAGQASVMTRAVKKWLSAMSEEGLMNRYAPTMVCTDQVRIKGIGFGQHARLAPAASNAVDHTLSLDIGMRAKGYEFRGDVAEYGTFEYTVDKNKAGGSPGVSGSFRFWLKPTRGRAVGDVEDAKVVIDQARGLGHVESGKSKYTLISEYLEDGSETFKTLKALTAFLENNPTVYADLRARVLSALIQKDELGEIVFADPGEEPSLAEEEEPEKPVRKGKKKGVKKGANPFTQKFKV